MSDICKINCRANGPYVVEGPLEILDPTGQKISIGAGAKVALCRCGGSMSKPYCDGTHGKIGFQAAEAAPPRT
jgi:CDGSH-type Zn-finger protein